MTLPNIPCPACTGDIPFSPCELLAQGGAECPDCGTRIRLAAPPVPLDPMQKLLRNAAVHGRREEQDADGEA